MIKISVTNTIESMYVCFSMWPCCFFLNQVVFQNEPCDKVMNVASFLKNHGGYHISMCYIYWVAPFMWLWIVPWNYLILPTRPSARLWLFWAWSIIIQDATFFCVDEPNIPAFFSCFVMDLFYFNWLGMHAIIFVCVFVSMWVCLCFYT